MRFRWYRIPYYVSVLAKIWRGTNWLKKEILLNGIKLKFANYTDLLEIKEVVFDREYESGMVKLKGSDKIVMDVGAGVGDFSIMAAKRLPKAIILAFEPDKKRYELLKDNLELNGVTNVRAKKEAVTTLPGNVDFLKIDCEGCEYKILKKARGVKKIAMELHLDRGDGQKLIGNLTKSGFQVETTATNDVPELMHVFASRG